MAAALARHYEMVNVPLKSGKPGKRWTYNVCPICPVARCERCGRFGSVTWVRVWHLQPWYPFDLRRQHQPLREREPTICIGCLNHYKPLWDAERVIGENDRLIGRIKREITRVNSSNRR